MDLREGYIALLLPPPPPPHTMCCAAGTATQIRLHQFFSAFSHVVWLLSYQMKQEEAPHTGPTHVIVVQLSALDNPINKGYKGLADSPKIWLIGC
eukprot:scaffold125688_cov15-Tisochrysis_lutea.AAC.1